MNSVKHRYLKVFWLMMIAGFSVHQTSRAQQVNNPVKSLHDHREFIVGIDNRITKINDRFGVIYGLYSGFGYGEDLRLKFSISGTPFALGKFSPDREVSQISRLLFASVGQEFDFFTAGKFKIASYLNLGYGAHFYRVIDQFEEQVEKDVEYMIPLELGLHGRYQVNDLIAFKCGGGYRFLFPSEADELSGYYIKLTFVVNPKKLRIYLKERSEKRRASGS